MGVIHHHAIIVTSSYGIEKLHAKAVELFGADVTPVTATAVNGYQSFMVAPDGSKEYWPESDQGDERRHQFVEFLREAGTGRWVEVAFGELETKIVNTNCWDED